LTENGTCDILSKDNRCPDWLRINASQSNRKRKIPLEDLQKAAGKADKEKADAEMV
jgi:hypothetical protein